MSFAVVQVVPKDVITIGDDGKNKSSHLFDKSLETRWSYKGKFAYNIVTLESPITLDSLTFHWYMKKKERRIYRYGVYLSDTDLALTSTTFDGIKAEIQGLYNDPKTLKGDNNDGQETTVMQFAGQVVKSFVIVYTYSSSKKSWFSVKEIGILGRTAVVGVQCPDGTKFDPVSNDCKPIADDDDEYHFDSNNVLLFEEEVGPYLSETHTFTRNFKSNGSMRLDVNPSDMGGKWRPDTEMLVFLKVTGKEDKEEVSAKTAGGPHKDDHPEWGRCEEISISFDAKRARFRQELEHKDGGVYRERDEVDITGLGLPDLRGIWYGYCFYNRRVLRKSDNKLLGRMLSLKVNPNPFDVNRNVLNANWIDVTTFLDKGQFKEDGKPYPIIDGPVDKDKYVDTIRTDGQNASTFGYRFFRHCQVQPIIVEDEEEMDKLFDRERNGTDEDEDEDRVSGILESAEAEKKDYIAPKYPTPLGDQPYFKITNQDSAITLTSGEIPGNFRNVEATAIMTFKKNAKDTANLSITARNHYTAVVGANGTSMQGIGDVETGTAGECTNFANFMTDVPSFKGRKIGFKWCIRTVKQFDIPADTDRTIVISEAFLNMEPDNPEFEYSPWWRAVYYGNEKEGSEGLVDKDLPVFVRWSSLNDWTMDQFEVREIEPVPEIRQL